MGKRESCKILEERKILIMKGIRNGIVRRI
jgi:hypothetical protein